ncbi:metal ABC transporter solute-binding protein, Zn/Mn family [Desmospora profundinema]|uniref:Zinc transport system substrate-binding protein n=1 Tax=Desmospora profundinema TaxID=1571184 RepID=A0ABU1IMI0_9BACL|nr:zinc ABC transporter substrate-binding protein [Desmospora profundinema]MDR6225994.1 zinc transport system substrate-binding protein [Desmospora profundinema]
MRKTQSFTILLIITAMVVAGCSSGEPEAQSGEKLSIHASLYPLADFAQKIGGDQVEVTNMVPAGVDPHDFEPTAKELAKMSESDIFLYNGAGFEGWIDKAKPLLDSEKTQVLDLSEGVDLLEYNEEHAHDDEASHEEDEHAHDDEASHGDEEHADGDEASHKEDEHAHDHEHGDYDPHVWLDPNRGKQMAAAIRDAIIEKDPDNRKIYEANYNELESRFDELDAKFKEAVEQGEKDTIIVSHAAFAYLTERYGLKQVAVSGLSPSDEPSAKKLKEIIDTAKKHDVHYIFFDTLVSGKVAKTVQNEVGAEALVLNPLEGLTKEQEQAGEDYFSLMNANADNLAKALK